MSERITETETKFEEKFNGLEGTVEKILKKSKKSEKATKELIELFRNRNRL